MQLQHAIRLQVSTAKIIILRNLKGFILEFFLHPKGCRENPMPCLDQHSYKGYNEKKILHTNAYIKIRKVHGDKFGRHIQFSLGWLRITYSGWL